MHNKKNEFFAEIIESSLTSFTARSWQWDSFPSLGSLIYTAQGDRIVYGLVHSIKTGSFDESRTPFAYKKTEAELKKELPHIFELLKTDFQALILGYKEAETINYVCTPEPPKIHSFIANTSAQMSIEFLQSTHYLYLIFSMQKELFNIDELLLSFVYYQQKNNVFDANHINSFIDTFCLLSGNDYKRLKVFLHRLQALMPQQISTTKATASALTTLAN